MNRELSQLITQMIREEKTCSSAIDYVPRPNVYLTPGDVLDEIKHIAKRIIGRPVTYALCRDTTAYKWREAAERAAAGL
jgi:hypothetical protein